MHRFNLGNPTDETDTTKLAAAAARGDANAFSTLYSLTADDLFGLSYLITFDEATAAQAVAKAYSEVLGLFETSGPKQSIEDELLERTQVAAAALAGDIANVAPAPTSPRDELAVAALARLSIEQRSALWLVEVLHQPLPNAAAVLLRTEKAMRETVRQARNNFRSYYAKAHSAGLVQPSHECASAQNLLAAYAGRNLNAGHTVAVEQHLSRCNDCRTTVSRLDDLEGRVRHILPPVPAFLTQLASEAVPMVKVKSGDFAAASTAAPFATDKSPGKPKKPSRREVKAAKNEEKAALAARAAEVKAAEAARRPVKTKPAKPAKQKKQPKVAAVAAAPLLFDKPTRVVDRTPKRKLFDWKAFGVAAGITAVIGFGAVGARGLMESESAPLLARSELPTTLPPTETSVAVPTTDTVPAPVPPPTEAPVAAPETTAPSITTTPPTTGRNANEENAPRAATAPPPPAPAPVPAQPPAPTTPPIVPNYELRPGVIPPTTAPPTTSTTRPPTTLAPQANAADEFVR